MMKVRRINVSSTIFRLAVFTQLSLIFLYFYWNYIGGNISLTVGNADNSPCEYANHSNNFNLTVGNVKVSTCEHANHCNNIPSGEEWQTFKSIMDLLNGVGANFTLSGGTVLAWYRDCSLVGNDDIDIYIEFTWFMENRDRLHDKLSGAGWRMVHSFRKVGEIGYEEAWKKSDGLQVDLFSEAHINGQYISGLTIANNTYPCYSPHISRPVHAWHDVSFPVPAPVQEYLVAQYSTTWAVKKKEEWSSAPFKRENGRYSCEKKDMPHF